MNDALEGVGFKPGKGLSVGVNWGSLSEGSRRITP